MENKKILYTRNYLNSIQTNINYYRVFFNLLSRLYEQDNFLPQQKKNGDIVMLCPLHKEKTPSLRVSKYGFFKCFGCGSHGDIFTLFQNLYKISFIKSVQEIEVMIEKNTIKKPKDHQYFLERFQKKSDPPKNYYTKDLDFPF